MANVNEVDGFRWYVLRTMTGREKIVEQWLSDDGFAIFNPTEKVFRYENGPARQRGKKRNREFPLFAGYLFIGFSPLTPTWAGVFRFSFVLNVIGFAGVPAPVAAKPLKKLIRKFASGDFNAPDHHQYMITGREFEVGDTVTTDDGLIEGKVREIRGSSAIIFVDILGAERQIEAHLDNLVAA